MLSDIEIAQKAKMKPIGEIAAKLGIPDSAIEPFGHTKADGLVHVALLSRCCGGVGLRGQRRRGQQQSRKQMRSDQPVE